MEAEVLGVEEIFSRVLEPIILRDRVLHVEVKTEGREPYICENPEELRGVLRRIKSAIVIIQYGGSFAKYFAERRGDEVWLSFGYLKTALKPMKVRL